MGIKGINVKNLHLNINSLIRHIGRIRPICLMFCFLAFYGCVGVLPASVTGSVAGGVSTAGEGSGCTIISG